MNEHPIWLSARVAGVILAGGRNSRMGGRDKAFLRVDGATVFERTLSVLRRCFSHVLVVSNTPEKYADYAVDVTRDELVGLGPLGGLHAALGRVPTPYAFVTACDMPFVREETIRYLVSRLAGQDAIVPEWDGDIEPLLAVYSTGLRTQIAAAAAAGVVAVRDFLPRIDVEYVPQAEMARVAGAEESFRNVNTPEDAARFAVQVGGEPA
ncbi:MAG: molybdenum cofactor guanylyltransferase [Deltaproteobacteria bacterium]|nr:molybdenum cofactor guanylyltransferase [Deltaproteobacteria bacterium]